MNNDQVVDSKGRRLPLEGAYLLREEWWYQGQRWFPDEYAPEQRRAAKYIYELTGIGGGDDPVGFLITSHHEIVKRNRDLTIMVASLIEGNQYPFCATHQKSVKDCPCFPMIEQILIKQGGVVKHETT